MAVDLVTDRSVNLASIGTTVAQSPVCLSTGPCWYPTGALLLSLFCLCTSLLLCERRVACAGLCRCQISSSQDSQANRFCSRLLGPNVIFQSTRSSDSFESPEGTTAFTGSICSVLVYATVCCLPSLGRWPVFPTGLPDCRGIRSISLESESAARVSAAVGRLQHPVRTP